MILFVWGSHLIVIRAYFGFFVQGSLLVGLRGPCEISGFEARSALCKTNSTPWALTHAFLSRWNLPNIHDINDSKHLCVSVDPERIEKIRDQLIFFIFLF